MMPADFFTIFQSVISEDRIIHEDIDSLYGAVTTGFRQQIMGALKPLNSSEILAIVGLCREHSFKLYPVSAGRNWGYSDSMPAVAHSIVLDLSLMTGIRDYNPELGIVTVESGVTQKMLYDFLQKRGGEHIISVTGSSPEASIVGNYLERGFGLLPVMDHAQAIVNLQAVLGNGSLYVSPLHALGAYNSAKVFRWGLGPYTDGLFLQSSFGVVTQMTIKLARKPESRQAIFVEVSNRDSLLRALDVLRDMRDRWGLDSLQIKVLNGYYSLASMGVKHDNLVEGPSIENVYARYKISPYMIMLTFSGPLVLVRTVQKHLVRHMRRHGRVRVVTDTLMQVVSCLCPFVPQGLKLKINTLQGLWSLFQGEPNTMAIGTLPYHRTPDDPEHKRLNPAKDKCGIIWFAPILPFSEQGLDALEVWGKRAQERHGFSPVLNFTNYGGNSIIGLLAIIFNQDHETKTAQECYMDLFYAARAEGYLPYRVPLFAMEAFLKEAPDRQFNLGLKSVLDPDSVFPRQC